MKKRSYFLLLILISIVLNAGAQQLKSKDLSSLEKIESVIQLSKKQKKQLKQSLLLRQDSLLKVQDNNLNKVIDSIYVTGLYRILTDSQSDKIIKAQINLKKVKNRTNVFFNKKIEPKGFPVYYKKILRKGLKEYEYDIAFVKIKYKYDALLREQEINAISQERRIWFSEHVNALKGVNKLWRLVNKQSVNLQASLKDDFVSYHLYAYFKKNKETLASEANQIQDTLINSEGFKKLIASIVAFNTEKVLARLRLKINDSTIHLNSKKELDSIYLNALKTKVTLSENLIDSQSNLGLINIPEFIRAKKSEKKNPKKDNTLNALAEKAKKAGLEEARVNQFIALVSKKEADIAAYKAAKKEKTTSSILGVDNKKKISEIKKDFLKDLTSLVNKKEFATILSDDLRPIAIKKAKKEMKDVLASYELNEEQRKAVYKKIKLYYLNETIANAYYKHDKRLLRQKLSGLRYHFEKEYKAMMDGFGVDMSPSKKAKKNTYQY